MVERLKLLRIVFRVLGTVAPSGTAWFAERAFTTPRRGRRPLAPGAQALADRAAHLELVHRGRVVRGLSWGAGPVVLLVHGWETRWSSLAALVEPLVGQGFRVVAFDAPAHGASEGKQTDGRDYGQVLAAVAGIVGPVYAMVGHSIGGATAVFLLAGRSVYPWEAPRIHRLVLISTPADIRDVAGLFAQRVGLPPRVVQETVRRMARRVGFPASQFSVAEALGELHADVLVVHDRDDGEAPFSAAEAFIREQPAARLFATSGLGHVGVLRAPEVVDSICGFLAGSVAVETGVGVPRN